jgi:hypothetical protein
MAHMNLIKVIIAACSGLCNLMPLFSSLGEVSDPVPDPVSQAIVIGLNSFPKAGLSVFTESLIFILI